MSTLLPMALLKQMAVAVLRVLAGLSSRRRRILLAAAGSSGIFNRFSHQDRAVQGG